MKAEINNSFIANFNSKEMSDKKSMLSIGILWLFTVSALIGIWLGFGDWFLPKTPLNLSIGFVLLLFNFNLGKNGFLVLITAILVGFFMEVAGVATGQIFGVYYYGENLGLKILEVPLMIGIYWGVLVVITSIIARKFFANIWLASSIGAFLMVFLDLWMEQLAPTFDFWYFEGGLAHIQNYIAWFLIAFVLQLLAFKWIKYQGSRYSVHLYLSQLLFFIVSYFYYL